MIDLARESGVAVTEPDLSRYDLYCADECFLTGTAMELIPVREIDGRVLPACPGSVYQILQRAFVDRIQSEHNLAPPKQAAS